MKKTATDKEVNYTLIGWMVRRVWRVLFPAQVSRGNNIARKLKEEHSKRYSVYYDQLMGSWSVWKGDYYLGQYDRESVKLFGTL